jgi:hypothetical protein
MQAMSSGAVQPAEEEKETPYLPPQVQVVNEADDETPSIDSLATTPRAGATQEDEPETPFHFGQVHVEEGATAQDAYMRAASAHAIRVPGAVDSGGETEVHDPLNPGGRPPLS